MLGFRGYKKQVEGSGLKYKFRTLKRELGFAWQRMWKGYDDTYWYSMNGTFIELYIELFTEWIDNIHSYPHDMTSREWEETLNLMKGYLIFTEKALDDDNRELATEYKNKFFELFSKHFFDLWD